MNTSVTKTLTCKRAILPNPLPFTNAFFFSISGGIVQSISLLCTDPEGVTLLLLLLLLLEVPVISVNISAVEISQSKLS